ncbi:hypothetical protein GCM10010234_48880 [Streptomyces hawaiiensis]
MDQPVRGGGGAAQDVEIVNGAADASAPAAARAEAVASERTSPTTWCPAPMGSGTTAEPIQPDTPVTKMRMGEAPDHRCQSLSSDPNT